MSTTNFGPNLDNWNKEELAKERRRKKADPADFNDPVALKVRWEAKQYNSSRNGSLKLRLDPANPDIVYYRLRFIETLIPMFFCLLGCSGFYLVSYLWNKGGDAVLGAVICSIISLVFAAIPFLTIVPNLKPKVFDKSRGCYWRGFTRPLFVETSDSVIILKDVHAVQVLVNRNEQYIVYELNLVLHNAEAITVHLHGERSSVKQDAELLGSFLGVPVWIL